MADVVARKSWVVDDNLPLAGAPGRKIVPQCLSATAQLDADARIGALGKLKIRKCASISGLPEIDFFRVRVALSPACGRETVPGIIFSSVAMPRKRSA
jgi:hypothetical protein